MSTSNPQTVLQRVVFPVQADPSALALYLDPDDWSSDLTPDTPEARLARARGFVAASSSNRLRLTDRMVTTWLRGRRSLEVPARHHVSLGAYFNAFPASYWARWTTLDAVVLRLAVRGRGQVIVYRSNARSVIQRVDTAGVDGAAELEFVLPFTNFLDGGWLWFDLVADDGTLTLEQADWCAPESSAPPRQENATVCITTLNRGTYCTELLSAIGSDPEATAVLDAVLVVDQGSERLSETPGIEAARASLGGRLRIIEQDNLGGSGGFARGMFETVRAGASGYALLLDDDVAIEPESIRRAVVFANHCHSPVIVGGHMFDMYDKSVLHAFAEGVKTDSFMWGPITPGRHDLADSNLRQTTWLHRRYDVDYNGWWMSLIPVSIIRDIGLSLPVFIKWDDAEYSLRAREHGYATVSLPGAAVWHVSWVDKDDAHDWQAFFHARNRLLTALLHSPSRRGGLLWRDNLSFDLKNLLSMDYYTVAMRHDAVRSVFAGPETLHGELRSRIGQVRELGRDFVEAQPVREVERIPHFPARQLESIANGAADAGPTGARLVRWLVTQLLRHSFSRVGSQDLADAQDHLSYEDARWFRVPQYDNVLVSNAEGSAASRHVRDPRTFRRMLARSIRLHRRYRRHWAALRRRYREALPGIVGMEAWAKTFGIDDEGSGAGARPSRR